MWVIFIVSMAIIALISATVIGLIYRIIVALIKTNDEGKRKKIRKTRQLLKRGGIIMTNNNKDVAHGPDKTARQEFGKFDFWVVVPVKATGYYINNWGLPSDGGLPPDTPGIRFKIVAAYNTKEEAVREAEKLIESGGYAFVHDVKEHIDYTHRNNWE